MLISQLPIANKILAALPRADLQRLLANMEAVELTDGQVLCEAGEPIAHVYFPNDCLVSLLTMVDGTSAFAVGLVGREGMVGVACALGASVSPVRAVVQSPGSAMRMKAAVFVKAFRHSVPLHRAVLLYVHALKVQISQTAACNRFHMIEARLARWLLMTRDRLSSDHFHLTHEVLGYMLGVRRVGVTNAAQALRHRHLIDYSRGAIAIIDGPGLQAASCSCYEMVGGRHGKG